MRASTPKTEPGVPEGLLGGHCFGQQQVPQFLPRWRQPNDAGLGGGEEPADCVAVAAPRVGPGAAACAAQHVIERVGGPGVQLELRRLVRECAVLEVDEEVVAPTVLVPDRANKVGEADVAVHDAGRVQGRSAAAGREYQLRQFL